MTTCGVCRVQNLKMILVILLLVFGEEVHPVRCDVKVQGGENAHEGEFPWAASIQQKAMTHYTMGVVTTMVHVITVCNTLKLLPATVKKMYVMAGSNIIHPKFIKKSSWKGQTSESTTWYTHPQCKAPPRSHGPWMYDYGVVLVVKAFQATKTLQPLKFNAQYLNYSIGFQGWKSMKNALNRGKSPNCTGIGWGFTVYNYENQFSSPSNDLKKVELKLLSDKTCVRTFCQHFHEFCRYAQDYKDPDKGADAHRVLTRMFRQFVCAESVSETQSDICGGDFGGSLICDENVIGLHAWTRFCGAKKFPSVHFSLAYGWEWFSGQIPGLPPIQPVDPSPDSSLKMGPSLAVMSWIIFIRL